MKPLARWNPARDVWETETTGLFCEHSDVWSETWPSSGMWAAGTVYAQPTSVHHMADSGSSLLPTPQTVDTQPAAPADMRRDSPNLRAITKFLPTPRTSDTNGAGQHGTGGPDLRTVVDLLPTPRATDGTKGGPNQRGSSGDLMLPSAVTHLLPTPTTTQRGPDANRETREQAGPNLHNVVDALLPTPSVADAMGGHLSRSGARSEELLLPGIVRTLTTGAATEDTETATEASRNTEPPSATDGITALLPTPTATPYGSNQSPSPGAAVRPSLDTLALTLLPTPTAMDSHASGGNSPSNVTLTDAVVRTSLGASTNPRFDAGSD